MDEKPIVVVNVFAMSYSGGTWLNLLLGSHSEAFVIGSLKHVRQVGGSLCMFDGEDCPVWSRFDVTSAENPFHQLHRLTDKRFLILKNSSGHLADQEEDDIDSKFVLLVRDGRAATASYMRKRPNTSIWKAAWWWRQDMKHITRRFKRAAGRGGMVVSYEELLDDTGAKLEEICDFVGMPYEPTMLKYWERDHHYIGGNLATLTQMARIRNRQVCADSYRKVHSSDHNQINWDLKHYDTTTPWRFVDDRWKKELSDAELRIFAIIAGGYNRRLGYSPSLHRGRARRAG